MYSEQLKSIFLTAWELLQSEVIPAGYFGNKNGITLWAIALAGTTIAFAVRFLNYCMGDDSNWGNGDYTTDYYKN